MHWHQKSGQNRSRGQPRARVHSAAKAGVGASGRKCWHRGRAQEVVYRGEGVAGGLLNVRAEAARPAVPQPVHVHVHRVITITQGRGGRVQELRARPATSFEHSYSQSPLLLCYCAPASARFSALPPPALVDGLPSSLQAFDAGASFCLRKNRLGKRQHSRHAHTQYEGQPTLSLNTQHDYVLCAMLRRYTRYDSPWF